MSQILLPTTSEEYEIRKTLSTSQRELEQITEEKNTLRQKETELLKKETEILKTIEYYKQRIAPWRKLNDECLLHIFVCLSEDYGPVTFPLRKCRGVPPQLLISNVCSRWRVLSLSAPSIWANVQIHKNLIEADLTACNRWLVNAGSYPVSLAIKLKDFESFTDIISAVPIRTLNIRLDFDQFETLHSPESIAANAKLLHKWLDWYSCFKDVKLAFTFFVHNRGQFDFNHRHHLLNRTHSIAFRGRFAKISNIGTNHVPWAQLSYLDIQDCKDMTLQEAIRILRQTTILEELYIRFEQQPVDIDGLEKVVLSCLRKLRLGLHYWDTNTNIVNDGFLKVFECPNLIELHLYTARNWSLETYNLLKHQYNLENLVELDMISLKWTCCFPMSWILRDAPKLRKLGLTDGIMIDDDAINGIEFGTLGRCLSHLWFRSLASFEEAVDMILSRQKNARQLVSESRNWKEDISLFRKIYVGHWTRKDSREVMALEDAGVEVEFIAPGKLKEDPFRPSILFDIGFDNL